MGLRRFANRRDANEPHIIAALEALGCLVHRMDKPVDLLVLHRGTVHLVEVKTTKGKLTQDQRDFAEGWPITVLRSVDEAIVFAAVNSKLARQREAA
jgi:hypothetical protein